MKVKSLFKTLLIFTLILVGSNTFAASWWPAKYSWPSDRIEDQVKILDWAQEFKINYFLGKLERSQNIHVHIHLVPSLQGEPIEEYTQRLMSGELPPENGMLFLVSLSDRQLKIETTPDMEARLSEAQINHLVKVVIPSLSQRQYSAALTIFFKNLVYQLDPQSSLSPPEPSRKKARNLRGFLFFVGAAFFIFLLGHKFFRRTNTLEQETSTHEDQGRSIEHEGVFW